MKYLLVYFIAVNTLTFLLYGTDKYLSKTHRRRISEFTLLFTSVIGGSAGSLLAMDIFRHKTLHNKFRIGVRIILFLQIILFIIAMILLFD